MLLKLCLVVLVILFSASNSFSLSSQVTSFCTSVNCSASTSDSDKQSAYDSACSVKNANGSTVLTTQSCNTIGICAMPDTLRTAFCASSQTLVIFCTSNSLDQTPIANAYNNLSCASSSSTTSSTSSSSSSSSTSSTSTSSTTTINDGPDALSNSGVIGSAEIYKMSEDNGLAGGLCRAVKFVNMIIVPISAVMITILGFSAFQGKLTWTMFATFAIGVGAMRGAGSVLELFVPGIGMKNGCNCAVRKLVRKIDSVTGKVTEVYQDTDLAQDCGDLSQNGMPSVNYNKP